MIHHYTLLSSKTSTFLGIFFPKLHILLSSLWLLWYSHSFFCHPASALLPASQLQPKCVCACRERERQIDHSVCHLPPLSSFLMRARHPPDSSSSCTSLSLEAVTSSSSTLLLSALLCFFPLSNLIFSDLYLWKNTQLFRCLFFLGAFVRFNQSHKFFPFPFHQSFEFFYSIYLEIQQTPKFSIWFVLIYPQSLDFPSILSGFGR